MRETTARLKRLGMNELFNHPAFDHWGDPYRDVGEPWSDKANPDVDPGCDGIRALCGICGSGDLGKLRLVGLTTSRTRSGVFPYEDSDPRSFDLALGDWIIDSSSTGGYGPDATGVYYLMKARGGDSRNRSSGRRPFPPWLQAATGGFTHGVLAHRPPVPCRVMCPKCKELTINRVERPDLARLGFRTLRPISEELRAALMRTDPEWVRNIEEMSHQLRAELKWIDPKWGGDE